MEKLDSFSDSPPIQRNQSSNLAGNRDQIGQDERVNRVGNVINDLTGDLRGESSADLNHARAKQIDPSEELMQYELQMAKNNIDMKEGPGLNMDTIDKGSSSMTTWATELRDDNEEGSFNMEQFNGSIAKSTTLKGYRKRMYHNSDMKHAVTSKPFRILNPIQNEELEELAIPKQIKKDAHRQNHLIEQARSVSGSQRSYLLLPNELQINGLDKPEALVSSLFDAGMSVTEVDRLLEIMDQGLLSFGEGALKGRYDHHNLAEGRASASSISMGVDPWVGTMKGAKKAHSKDGPEGAILWKVHQGNNGWELEGVVQKPITLIGDAAAYSSGVLVGWVTATTKVNLTTGMGQVHLSPPAKKPGVDPDLARALDS